ncbi:MAG: M6 family metalloprotease domain-containing protein [Planctomycetes bacterium]|nr:M6 family metalloprotease domain-containing protein [Planctomycetota bacterium]
MDHIKCPTRWLVLIALWCVTLSLPFNLFAAIHEGEICILKQPDKSYVQLRVWGDEFYQRVESLDGYTLIRDPITRWICYAQLAPDASDFLSTGIIYHGAADIEGRSFRDQIQIAGLTKHQQLNPNAIREKVSLARTQLLSVVDQEQQISVMLDDVSATGELTGSVLGLTLLIEFPDEPNDIPPSEVENYTNQVGYSNYGNNGSVRDYFYDVSNGLLTYTNYIAEYYTAQHEKEYYTDPNITYGVRARELVTEALVHLESNGFDFSILSTDSYGRIRAINAFYAGSRDNAWAKGLWPHKSTLSPTFYADGVHSGSYQITNMGTALSLSTFCHENGHMLFGWPDLYDYGHDSNGIGRFGIMCSSGSYTNPIPPCAYLRMKAGWETIVEITNLPPATLLEHQANSFSTYKYSHPEILNEYFLIESRLKTGRNTYLADEGLIIWHIDEFGSNNYEQMTPSQHYKVSVEQADGLFELEYDIDYGDENDLFHEGNNETFDDYTVPDAHWWFGDDSGLIISNISSVGSTMSFTLGSVAGHWKFDEASGTAAYDFSGANLHGSLINGPVWTASLDPNFEGVYGGALQFDGLDDYVEIDDYTGIAHQQSRTVAAWIKTDAIGDIITWGNHSPGQKWRLHIQNTYGAPGALGLDVNSGFIAGVTDLRDGLWHHIAAVLNSQSSDVSQIELYVDGQLESISASAPYTIDTVSDTNVKIGAYFDSEDPNYFKGLIDEVRIFGIPLSQPEIVQLATPARLPENPNPDYLNSGLEYEYYSGVFSALPDFDALNPDDRGFVSNFDLSPASAPDDFALRFHGYLEFFDYGEYTFYLNSDEGSQLYIGNTLVVDNDGLHPVVEASGTIPLKAGKHAITVLYFERDLTEILQVSYQGPGFNKMPIPNSALYHVEGLLTHWKLDDTEGATTDGTPEHGYRGILRNDPQWQPDQGQIDGALLFDGIDDFVEIPGYQGITGSHSRTVSAWINTGNAGEILAWGQPGFGALWLMHIGDNDAISLNVGGGEIAGETNLCDGQWHHVAAVLDADQVATPDVSHIKLYVDGQSENISGVIPQEIHTAPGYDVTIGVYQFSGNLFSGLIDDVRIYNLPLTPNDITDLYYQGKPCGAIPADWTGPAGIPDCYVNLLDLALFCQYWLDCNNPTDQSCEPPLILPMDLTGPNGFPDGYVNLHDFNIFTSYWLQCNNPNDPNCNWTWNQ